MLKMGFGFTCSYCTMEPVLEQLQRAVEAGYDVIPIASLALITEKTRYGDGEAFKKRIEEITNKEIVTNIIDAEQFGPFTKLDVLVIAPATGDFIAKLANGITDSTVNMATKATLRNQSPVVIGVATNDGLSFNGSNIINLLKSKNIYFIPFGQDDYIKKPNSLVSHFDLLLPTVEAALQGKQYQPVIKEHQKILKPHQ